MQKTWRTLRHIIGNAPRTNDLFLSVIEEDGHMVSANMHMVKKLELKDPRTAPVNFFDLVHPVHLDEFRKTLRQATTSHLSNTIEVYIKNGDYHPMKWEVNYLEDKAGNKKTYFCVGYKLLDDERSQRFNILSEKHHQLIIEGSNGIIFHDRAGEIIATNQKTTRIFNTSLEDIYQLRNIRELWDTQWEITDEEGNRVAFAEAPFMMAYQTGQPQKKTLVIRLQNGDHRYVVYNSQVLPAEEAQGGLAIVSSIIDVTKEKMLNRELKEQEVLFDVFLKETPHLAWVLDEEATLLFASRAFFLYFKLIEKEAIGRKITDILPEAVIQSIYKQHVEVLNTGDSVETLQQAKLADGANIIFQLTIFPIHMPSGKTLLGGHAVSLPDKSRLELELRQTQARLLHFTRATSDAIWEWDMQTGQIFRNESLMTMIGYQPDHSKGLSWWLRRIHPDDRNRVADQVKEATDLHRQSWQDEYRFKRADGEYIHIQDKGFVVYENGLPVRMIGSLQDVSGMKELQDQLADERLQRQKEISETVVKVQEKERSRIGHELHDNVNQILSTATLFLDMLKAGNKEQQQVKDKSIEYLKMAVEEIRKLSKELVTPKLKEEKLTDSIQKLVDDISMAGVLKISFTHDHETELLSAGKKVTLFRIVQEQLKNVLTHSKAKTINIFLQVKADMAELIVQDDGHGFDPGLTHQGIGLSNIHERTHFYNGTVDIQAAPGRGCKMIVRMPAYE